MTDLADLPCPRCGGSLAEARFYGPCKGCTAEILAAVVPPGPDSDFTTVSKGQGESAPEYGGRAAYVGPRREAKDA